MTCISKEQCCAYNEQYANDECPFCEPRNVCKYEKVERKAQTFFEEGEKCGNLWEGGGFLGLCSNPQKIQSERVEGVDLPEEKGGG